MKERKHRQKVRLLLLSIEKYLYVKMGGGRQFLYPKWVWSPAGGWWANPTHWKRNTIIYGAFVAGAACWTWRISNEGTVSFSIEKFFLLYLKLWFLFIYLSLFFLFSIIIIIFILIVIFSRQHIRQKLLPQLTHTMMTMAIIKRQIQCELVMVN